MVLSGFVVAAQKVHGCEDAVHVAVIGIESDRDLKFVIDGPQGGITVGAPIIDIGLADDAGAPSMSMCITGVECQRPFDYFLRLDVVFHPRAMVKYLGSKDEFIRGHILGRVALDELIGGGFNPSGQRRDNGRRHLVLDSEDILKLSVVALGPDVPIPPGINELDGNADPVSNLADAALHDVVHVESLRNLLNVHGFALVDERGIAGDDQELSEPGQGSDDVLGQAIGEKLLINVATHVHEWQHSNRRAFGQCRRRLVR